METALDQYQRERVGLLRPLMQMIAEANRRELAKREAAIKCGLSFARIESLFLDWKKRGDEALIEKRKLTRSKKRASEIISLTDAETNSLRRLSAQCNSIPFAIECFADLPETRTELRTLINSRRASRNYPKALRRAARITPEMSDLARGNKRFSLHATTQFRTNTWIDSAGVEHLLTGGDLFECDDMSLNQPFWYEWPYGGDDLSDKFGVRLGRQMLACIDTATGKWIGFDLIGRVRDAYRAEDVIRFLGRIGDNVGLPRLGFRLERGVWASRSVRGVKGTRDEDEQKTFASIRDVVNVHYVYSPKAKGVIEGSFNLLQTILATTGIQIGRKRGEYEKTTSLALKCAAGGMHPKDAGFPHINEIAERVHQAMHTANARQKNGRLLTGIPSEKFEASIIERPLKNIPTSKDYLFLPVRQIRPITGGFLRYRVPHYSHIFSFAVPEGLAHLGRGYRLLLCFDPANPHAGARVFDAENDSRLHYESTPNQDYGTFEYVEDKPQLDFSGRTKQRSAYAAAARTTFRSLGMQIGTGASIEQVADGRGSSICLQRNGNSSASVRQRAETHAEDALNTRQNYIRKNDRSLGRTMPGITSNSLLSAEDGNEPIFPRTQINSLNLI